MAPKKTTAKKAATKKTTKKATKKVAAKKTTKKVAKKTAKKSAKKAAKKTTKKVTAVEQELNLNTKVAPTLEQLQQAAYLNYLDRTKNDYPGSPETDWAKAEQDLA